MRRSSGAGDDTIAPVEISVVIPTFNNCDVLRRTIEALTRQTLPPSAYEIVVADDGSTDGTRAMVAEARRGPVAIQYVVQANGGRSAARNRGARAARGRVLLFIDADIWSAPALLATHHAHYPPGVS